MKNLIQSVLAATVLMAGAAQAATTDTTTFSVTVPFVADILTSKDLTAGQANTVPVCYTANAPAQITIDRQTTAGAADVYPVALTPTAAMGTVVDANTVNVPANTTTFGVICDGTVASSVAFNFIFNAPTGEDLAASGTLAGTYSTDVTVSIAAL
ncbi:hypothetical protein [Agitococcus lubricus]|uniref:Uncharacterized protein n=1 Tax=Agitococcus lubricus TaxID=1077255 RepID=A0A2T5J3Y5_9GAMM|nr:hypothetical protein [Agitococcus lubricus]PTQ91329.1 hypothetical protein C8N29_101402 [Agitococcus lubricus]